VPTCGNTADDLYVAKVWLLLWTLTASGAGTDWLESVKACRHRCLGTIAQAAWRRVRTERNRFSTIFLSTH
jgi:hypothetical protein